MQNSVYDLILGQGVFPRCYLRTKYAYLPNCLNFCCILLRIHPHPRKGVIFR